MAFTMTHLIISYNTSGIFSDIITNLPPFYLGTIAPDAVHNRAGYVSDFKKASHLITGTEKWGMVTDNDGWKDNVISFLHKHKDTEHRDFILGYCSHILSDMYNNIKVWTPFRLKHDIELEKGYGNIHHQESYKIDTELALMYENRGMFWHNLRKSNSIDFPDIIFADEMDKQKSNILNLWYKDIERPDLSSNKIRTLKGELEFIKNATEYVAAFFRENLA